MSPAAARSMSRSRAAPCGCRNLDKVLYPRTGTTKGEVLHYYAQVAPVLLPHLRDRAVTRIRWPHGVERAELLREERSGRDAVVGADRASPDHAAAGRRRATATTWSSRSATTSPRSPGWPTWPPWSCTCTSGRWASNGRPRNPDRLVIDLDPGEPAGLSECCQVALLVRDRLTERGARPGGRSPAAPRACICTPACRGGSTPTRRRRSPRRSPRSCRPSIRGRSRPR